MRSIIKTLFLVLISNSSSGASELNANNILNLFPICEISSSLGQKCKYEFAEIKPDSFLEVCCSDGANVEYNENSVSVLSNRNWYYNFDISRSSDGNYEIIFTDKAMNGGSYHSVTTFDVKIVKGKLKKQKIENVLY